MKPIPIVIPQAPSSSVHAAQAAEEYQRKQAEVAQDASAVTAELPTQPTPLTAEQKVDILGAAATQAQIENEIHRGREEFNRRERELMAQYQQAANTLADRMKSAREATGADERWNINEKAEWIFKRK